MRKQKSTAGLMVLALLAVIVMHLSGLTGNTAQAADKTGDWKDVTILYTTDIKGKIEPCG